VVDAGYHIRITILRKIKTRRGKRSHVILASWANGTKGNLEGNVRVTPTAWGKNVSPWTSTKWRFKVGKKGWHYNSKTRLKKELKIVPQKGGLSKGLEEGIVVGVYIQSQR